MAYFDKYGVAFSDDGKILISCPKNLQGAYTIPSRVVEIADFAFRECDKITSITIPDSVVIINTYVLFGCANLKEIIVPKGQKLRFAKMEGLEAFVDDIREEGETKKIKESTQQHATQHRSSSAQEIEDMRYYEAEARFIEENYGVDIRDSIF